MTLDIKKYLKNLIEKEAVVSHFKMSVDAGKASKVKGPIANAIRSAYGERFLDDADYVLFLSRPEGWSSKDIKKVFELTDRALGKDANKLSKADFLPLDMNNATDDNIDDELDNDVDDDVDDEEETALQEDDTSASATILFVKITLK